MANRYVVPHEGQYAYRKEGSTRVSKAGLTQTEAADLARRATLNDGGGEVRIQRPNGQFRASNTYGKKDPFPPRG